MLPNPFSERTQSCLDERVSPDLRGLVVRGMISWVRIRGLQASSIYLDDGLLYNSGCRFSSVRAESYLGFLDVQTEGKHGPVVRNAVGDM